MSAIKNIQTVATALAAAFVAFAFLAEASAATGVRASGNAKNVSDTNFVDIATNTNTNVVAVLSKRNVTFLPIAEARAKIGDIIANPEKMVEVMRSLSPEDQKTFVADVNAAIEKLPGSTEDKTAKYLNVNRAALKGATAGNVANVLAVKFATVSPESLTVVSERFATDLFNRDADPSVRLSDEAFEKTAKDVIGKVVQATAGSDDAGVRNTLAVVMFVKASNDSIDGLTERLVETLPNSEIRELATTEWIPAAMTAGDQKSYDALLAYADAGKAPNLNVVLNLAGPQILDAMLIDITSSIVDGNGYQTIPFVEQAFGGFEENIFPVLHDTTGLNANNPGAFATPRTTDPTKPWNPAYNRGSEEVKPKPTPTPQPTPPGPTPPPYPYTSM